MFALREGCLQEGHNNVDQPEIDINKVEDADLVDGNTALHNMCDNKALFLAGSDKLTSINHRNRWGKTPIIEALECSGLIPHDGGQ